MIGKIRQNLERTRHHQSRTTPFPCRRLRLYDTPECCGRKSSSKKAATTCRFWRSRTQRVGRRRSRPRTFRLPPPPLPPYVARTLPSRQRPQQPLGRKRLARMDSQKRGAVLSGGRINYQKAAENILTDFRERKIGRITSKRRTNGKLGSKKPVRKKLNSKPYAKPVKQSVKGRSLRKHKECRLKNIFLAASLYSN